MSQKKEEAEKQSLVARLREWPYYFAAMWAAGAAIVLIIAALFTVGPSSPGATQVTGKQADEMLERIESNYAGEWRDLGFTSWSHNEKNTLLFVDSARWLKLSTKEQKERIGTVGADFAALIETVGGNAKDVYIMVHDENGRMPGEYDGAKGAGVFIAE